MKDKHDEPKENVLPGHLFPLDDTLEDLEREPPFNKLVDAFLINLCILDLDTIFYYIIR
tara:strand:+ start:941 stop:1117 length:177 start_codon:yes stop_codon:yes gene_type:complete